MARVYLDACIVIYLIQGPQELSTAILQALRPQEFWTNDHRLSAAARNRIELKVFS